MIQKEIRIPIDESIRTDCTCVLGYIRNEDKRFHSFVANCVAAIQEVTSPLQWRHVGTKENPADNTSRGPMAENLLKNKRWLRGSKFLWTSEETWPNQQPTASPIAVNDLEVKKECQVFFTNAADSARTVDNIFERFSLWYRLKKFKAWMLKLDVHFIEIERKIADRIAFLVSRSRFFGWSFLPSRRLISAVRWAKSKISKKSKNRPYFEK